LARLRVVLASKIWCSGQCYWQKATRCFFLWLYDFQSSKSNAVTTSLENFPTTYICIFKFFLEYKFYSDFMKLSTEVGSFTFRKFKISHYSDRLRAARPGFDSWKGQHFWLPHNAHTASGIHPASYPVGMGAGFPGGKRPQRELTAHLHLVPRSIRIELYIHSPHTSSWGGA
jgi:hypothetical protein